MKRLMPCLVTLLFFAIPAFAHDEMFHKGAMIEGKLSSLNGDRADLQTDKGSSVVMLYPETTYELGSEGKPGKRADLKEGAHLMVHGHKLETGEFGAKEIMIYFGENAAAVKHSGDTAKQ